MMSAMCNTVDSVTGVKEAEKKGLVVVMLENQYPISFIQRWVVPEDNWKIAN